MLWSVPLPRHPLVQLFLLDQLQVGQTLDVLKGPFGPFVLLVRNDPQVNLAMGFARLLAILVQLHVDFITRVHFQLVPERSFAIHPWSFIGKRVLLTLQRDFVEVFVDHAFDLHLVDVLGRLHQWRGSLPPFLLLLQQFFSLHFLFELLVVLRIRVPA